MLHSALCCATMKSHQIPLCSAQTCVINGFLFKKASPRLSVGPLGFSEGFNKQIHGPRAHQCQRDVPAVPEPRAPLQLHHPQILPGADQTLPEPAAQEGQGPKGQNGAAAEWPGEAQEHFCPGKNPLAMVFLVLLVWFREKFTGKKLCWILALVWVPGGVEVMLCTGKENGEM